MVAAIPAISKRAMPFLLVLAMASGAHAQVKRNIADYAEEAEVIDTPDNELALTEVAGPHHGTLSSNLYISEPDVARCEAGTLRREARAGFVEALNAERARHHLGPVDYDTAFDEAVTAAALIMAANAGLTHEPPPSWRCWTASGASGAGSSNLLLNVASGDAAPADDAGLVAQWIIEGGSDGLGHRRWILDPFLTRTALGRVTQILPDGSRIDAAVMKVFDFSDSDPTPTQLPEFIAWPQGDYPRRLFSPAARLSFTVVTGVPGSDAAAGVDFSRANVAVSSDGTPLHVSALEADNEDYGVANCLSWRVAGLQSGRRYVVMISGVEGAPRSRYVYDFTIEPG